MNNVLTQCLSDLEKERERLTVELDTVNKAIKAFGTQNTQKSSGIRYLESKACDRPEKAALRNKIVQKCIALPGAPKIMTFPGENWYTEKAIIEGRAKAQLEPATFLSLENDKVIFDKSLYTMPSSSPVYRQVKDYKKSLVGSNGILLFADFVSLDFSNTKIDFAWIDFVGYLTDSRIVKLKELWGSITNTLVITSMVGRWRASLNERIQASSLGNVIREELPCCKVTETVYGNRPKMHHIVLEK